MAALRRLAFASSTGLMVDEHFGRSGRFVIIDADPSGWYTVGTRLVPPANAAGNASVVGNFIRASGGGDDADSTLTVVLTQLPTDGTLYYTGVATINGVSQTLTNHAVTAADIAGGPNANDTTGNP